MLVLATFTVLVLPILILRKHITVVNSLSLILFSFLLKPRLLDARQHCCCIFGAYITGGLLRLRISPHRDLADRYPQRERIAQPTFSEYDYGGSTRGWLDLVGGYETECSGVHGKLRLTGFAKQGKVFVSLSVCALLTSLIARNYCSYNDGCRPCMPLCPCGACIELLC